MSEALLAAIANLATADHLLHLALGVMLGLAVGAFPGLGGIAPCNADRARRFPETVWINPPVTSKTGETAQ